MPTYPISHYIQCIDSLGKPYPSKYLKAFLSQYTGLFTRYTSPDLIFFDGKSVVTIQSSPTKITNQEIEKMLKGLVAYHGDGTNVAQRYSFAIGELLKRQDDRYIKPQEVVLSKRTPLFNLHEQWTLNITGNAESRAKLLNYAMKIYSSENRVYALEYPKIDDPIFDRGARCYRLTLYVEGVVMQDFLNTLHSSITVKDAEEILPKECSARPSFMTSIPFLLGKSHLDKCLFTFCQGDPHSRKGLSKEELDVLYDGDNHYKYFNTLGVNIDTTKYIQASLGISGTTMDTLDTLKNKFAGLLYTCTVDRPTGLELLSGTRKYFYANTNFTYGLRSPEPGEMVFILKDKVINNPNSPSAAAANMKMDYVYSSPERVSVYDIDIVLVDKSMLSFATVSAASKNRSVSNAINPFRNKVQYFSFTESNRDTPLILYLDRCLYYGLFTGSEFKFV